MTDGGPLSDFIDGLGPGQLVGRQVLGDPSRGDIQLSMCHQKGYLEVEVIRARGLQVFYLMFNHLSMSYVFQIEKSISVKAWFENSSCALCKSIFSVR